MAAITVLAVGVDLSVNAKKDWDSRGVFLTFVQTPGEAVSVLRHGDFDLCVLGSSVSAESRAKLVSALSWLLHSGTPVISIGDELRSLEELEKVIKVNGSSRFSGLIAQLLSEARHNASLATQWGKETEEPRYGKFSGNLALSRW